MMMTFWNQMSQLRGSMTNNNRFWIGFIGTSLQLQPTIAAHNQWLSKARSIPYWTASVFSSTVTNEGSLLTPMKSKSKSHCDWRSVSQSVSQSVRLGVEPHTPMNESESESYVTTDSQSASLFWYKAPIWGLRPDLYYCQTVAGLSIWGALSNERTGLSFTIAAGPSQRSNSRVRAPWDSRPYFTVSDLTFPILSPPTTRRVTMDWVWCYDRRSVGQSVLVQSTHLGLTTRFLLPYGIRNTSDSCGSVDMGRSLTRGRFCRLQLLLALASAVILGSESLGTRDHIYCLRFKTSFVRHSR
jgi:hypothetical protein